MGMSYLVFCALILSSISIQAQVRCDDIFPAKRKKFSLPADHETLLLTGQRKSQRIEISKSFNLLVWNIYKAREDFFWDDFNKLQKLADISLLQETVFNLPACDTFRNIASTQWTTALSFWQEEDSATGVTTGSKFFVNEYDFIRSPDREPIIKTPKMASYTKYPINGSLEELVVVNLHGMNVTPKSYLANQLEAIEERIGNHRGPLIVAGDYNTRNSGRNKILDEFAERMGLNILVLKNDARKKKLDHILARGLKINKAEILTEIQSSDHPALWAELQVE